MKRWIITCCLFITIKAYAQSSFKALIKDDKTKEILQGASANIDKLKMVSTSDSEGKLILKNVPNGEFEIEFRFVGYKEYKRSFKFPIDNTGFIEINLEQNAEELNEVTVQTTRSNRNIQDIPSRIEFL